MGSVCWLQRGRRLRHECKDCSIHLGLGFQGLRHGQKGAGAHHGN